MILVMDEGAPASPPRLFVAIRLGKRAGGHRDAGNQRAIKALHCQAITRIAAAHLFSDNHRDCR